MTKVSGTSGVFAPSPAQPIIAKIGMGCPVADIISHAKFQLNRFRDFRAPDGRTSLSPIDLRHHLQNSYALPCYTVICPTAIAYSMGQMIKSVCLCLSVCVCLSVSLSVRVSSLSRSRFFVDFHQIGHRDVNPQK